MNKCLCLCVYIYFKGNDFKEEGDSAIQLVRKSRGKHQPQQNNL